MPVVSDVPGVQPPAQPLHVTLYKNIVEFGRDPNRPALIDPRGVESVTFRQLGVAALSMARLLQNEGCVIKGDVVSCYMPTSWRFPIAYLGIMTSGAVVTGAGVDGTLYETARHFHRINCKVVVTDSEFVHELVDAIRELPDEAKPVLFVFMMDPEDDSEIDTTARIVRIQTSMLYRDDLSLSSVYVPIDLDADLATLFFSSGTTGLPKGVMTTHSNLAYMSAMEMRFSEQCVYPVLHEDGFDGRNEVMMMYMPLHMAMSFFTCVQSLRKGVAQVMIRCPIDVFEHIPKFRPTTFVTSPSMLDAIASQFSDCSAITNLTVGAAPTTRRQYNEVRKAYPGLKYFAQGYGMSELTVACCYTDFREPIPFGSVGKILPNMVLKIVNEKGKECDIGEEGELWVKGPNVMKGYLDNPEATKETIDEDGFLHTGDIGYVNETNHIFITARMKELIKVEGRQVAPAEIESELSTHPAIEDVAVIGVPTSGREGELIRAFVVRRAGVETDENDIKGYLIGKLSPYKQLSGGVQFINSIPRHRTGKILRDQLREKYCLSSKL